MRRVDGNISDALVRIRKIIGAGSTLSLRRGGKLYKWTRSVPRNVWVESTRGQQLWHSSNGEAPPWEYFDLIAIENEGSSHVFQLKKEYLLA